ncbi:hypothetical protein F5Y10DRAFT_238296 [Nemania abortiva]|nr:hypothetical protein F5Y10DRAFT_238296 [Nemania abortiva]
MLCGASAILMIAVFALHDRKWTGSLEHFSRPFSIDLMQRLFPVGEYLLLLHEKFPESSSLSVVTGSWLPN